MTYLPTNKNIVDKTVKVVEINESMGETVMKSSPRQVLDDMIVTFSITWSWINVSAGPAFSAKISPMKLAVCLWGNRKKAPPRTGTQGDP